MRYLVWALRLVVFVVVLMFALNNTNVVTVHFFDQFSADTPLIVVMLACFVLGAVLGLLITLPAGMRRRREVARQRRELDRLRHEADHLRDAANRHAQRQAAQVPARTSAA